jgi:trimeric autotransporter adhesin
MGSVVISGATSGAITLAVPAEAGTHTVTIPAATGQLLNSGDLSSAGDTSAGDAAAIGYTAAEGLILTGQGSTSDVTIKNDADATVLSIPTGTTNVGIGTTAPGAKLSSDVSGTSSLCALNLTNSGSGTGAGVGVAINFGLATTLLGSFGKIEVLNETATTGSNSYMAFSTRGGDTLAERMRIASNGYVGIGITNPAALLDVPGTAYINAILGGRTNGAGNFHIDSTGSGAVYLNWYSGSGGVVVANGAGASGVITASAFNVSDRNEKENIEYFSEGLNKILQLKPAKFNFIGKENTESGLIAQDVQEVIPEMLGSYTKVDAEEPTLTLSNTILFPYLINAIKEQQTTIEALEARITALEA